MFDLDKRTKAVEMVNDALWEEFISSMTEQEMLDQWNEELDLGAKYAYTFDDMDEKDIENFEYFKDSLFEEFKEDRL